MALLRQGAKPLKIMEQLIEDPVSGLTLRFQRMPDGTQKLKLFGDFQFGNREFIFNAEGQEAGAGVALTDPFGPSCDLPT